MFSNDVQPITVVMLLDRSGSMMPNFDLEERAAEAFVEAMGPADKARIGSFAEPPIRNLSRASRSPPGRADRHNSGFFIKHKRELTTLPILRYSSGHRKGRLKFLFSSVQAQCVRPPQKSSGMSTSVCLCT